MDPDINGNGVPNGEDPDSDGDGIPNWDDPSPNGCADECCGSSDPCCGVTDPCAASPCGDPCNPECVNCDDGDPCTVDSCQYPDGDCSHTCPIGLREDDGAVASDCAQPFAVEIEEISFQNDLPLFRGAPPSNWQVGLEYEPPDWTMTNNPDNPVCYSRNRTMRLEVKVRVTGGPESSGNLRVLGPNGLNGTTGLGVPCGERTGFVYVTTSALPNYPRHYLPMELEWYARPTETDEYTYFRSTFHDVYVTYGTPSGSTPTWKRVEWVCEKAFGLGSQESIVGAIHAGLANNPPNDGNSGIIVDDWRLMAGTPYSGECHQQAHLFNLAVQLIGITTGNEYLTLASSDTNIPTTTTLLTFFIDVEKITAGQLGITQDLDGDGTIGEETLELIFDFNPPPNPGDRNLNNFEGSVKMPWGNYAVWPSLKAPTECCLLLQLRDSVGAKQYWGYRLPSGGFAYIHYAIEVPFPTCPTNCQNPN